MKQQFLVFVVRWILNSFGLWIAVRLLGTGRPGAVDTASLGAFLIAGLIFSLINTILKPLLVILSLPAILVSLGLFMLIVNGILVYISIALAPGLSMSFLNAILTGIILSLLNYIVSAVVELQRGQSGENL
jgi:putative membrane protein